MAVSKSVQSRPVREYPYEQVDSLHVPPAPANEMFELRRERPSASASHAWCGSVRMWAGVPFRRGRTSGHAGKDSPSLLYGVPSGYHLRFD